MQSESQLHPIQLLDNSEKHGPNPWAPDTYMEDAEVPGFWFHISPALTVVIIWGMRQWRQDISFSLSVTLVRFVCNTDAQIDK